MRRLRPPDGPQEIVLEGQCIHGFLEGRKNPSLPHGKEQALVVVPRLRQDQVLEEGHDGRIRHLPLVRLLAGSRFL